MLKKSLLLICLAATLLSFQTATEYAVQGATVIEDKTTLPLLDPAFAKRQTLKLKLDNGLQALLISDPAIDKSSATLIVNTGSWEDPKDAPGIAHFTEHMLFLGTKKYPTEMDYDRFISEHGGMANAFTTNDVTGFLFTINNNALPEAIDRFAGFFTEPLFNPSGVDRELQAIDQEYAKNLENDDFRAYYIQKELGNQNHPNHAFSMGNKESLSTVSQDTLKKWYQEHYSANRMRLEIISSMPLSELAPLVVDAFGAIPNKNLPETEMSDPLFTDAIKGKIIYVEPAKDLRRLLLMWEIPKKFVAMRDTKPETIICHILGHEGEKSLLDTLKYEKLAEGIQCGMDRAGADSCLLFIQLDLTNGGVKQIDKVVLRCFEAIVNFRNKGIPQYLFDELKRMSDLDYQYQTKSNAFEHIFSESLLLQYEDMETYPEQTQTIKRFDSKSIQELLDFLTPQNCIIQLLAPKNLLNISFDKKEPWLGVPYAVATIPEKTLALWNSAAPNPRIDLPSPNPYIPDNTTVLPPPSVPHETDGYYIPKPSRLLDDDHGTIYFAQDTSYNVPRVSWIFNIRTPSITLADAESIVLGDLFIRHANETLSNYTYPAYEAGLNFAIQRSDNGILLSIDGYSDKAQELFLDLLRTLKEAKPREQTFRIYKELQQREYQNMALESPLVQAREMLLDLLYKNFPSSRSKAAAIKKVSYDAFNDFSNQIFAKTFIEGTVYGNIDESESKDLIHNLITVLDSASYPKDEHLIKEVIDLSDTKGPFYMEIKSKVKGNAAALAVAMAPFSLEMRAAQQILMQAIKEPFFTSLRTKQQTGYLVMSQGDDLEQHLFDFFAVQSNTHDSRDLLARFEQFLEGFIQEINKGGVSKERFENIKKALLVDLKQPPLNITDMNALLYKLAFLYRGDFDWIAKRIHAFEALTYEQFLTIAKETFGKENKRRLAVLFSGSIPLDGAIKYNRLNSSSQLRDKTSFSPSILEQRDGI